jgi:phytoene synthase
MRDGTVCSVPADPSLRGAYRACARLQRRHDPTYYWATRRLPRDVQGAVHALYGYVRTADELVDGPGRPPEPEARRAELDAWQAELERGSSRHPVVVALLDAGRRHDLPLHELGVYMDAMRVDCGPVRMRDDGQLDRYMRGSAGAVGIIMARLLGAEAEALARMGAAFQLTNFIRDVREDWTLDRVYLPGLDEADLAANRASAGFRERVAAEDARARELFASTAHALDLPGVGLARAVYLRVLDRAERADFDVLCRRAALPPWEAARAALSAR